ncbi:MULTISPECIES: thioesterase family protein [Mycobacteriaceae]|uniref:Thioesterase n=1 Tax=Mycolicibacterium neoaurum VKM Ac-1815D TaxID=700508 RepID=V5XE37_MYCNE|nr:MULTISPECIES: thioesterase family protein [Mycobacteriaceae]AMO06101.1 thioesterase [Mycolicibacterium neoaurum]AXK75556.1 thioesterase family protein [Mycolicibacterium neoaurum]KUM09560.1 thioesterase [Mycolicibacterium neoaurum]MDO3399047.1 thioesterase family protein [Mycolicibacterium neoaurum]
MTAASADASLAPHYRRLGSDGGVQLFESTISTASNWGTAIQHGSPPLALLTKAIEELYLDRPQLRVGRLLLDILGAVPVAPVRVRAWVQRPGARISLAVAEMCPADAPDRPVARVSAWLLATGDTADVRTDRYTPLTEGVAVDSAHGWLGAPGYLETVSWRNQATEPGAAAQAWMSPLVPLVDDEPTTPLQRLAQVVDSANGIGAVLEPADFAFMNTDTAVHLHRVPRGNDFGLRARASIGPDGIGVTTAEIFDRDGFIGTSAQTLLVQRTH